VLLDSQVFELLGSHVQCCCYGIAWSRGQHGEKFLQEGLAEFTCLDTGMRVAGLPFSSDASFLLLWGAEL
jgi:hypothetical protein